MVEKELLLAVFDGVLMTEVAVTEQSEKLTQSCGLKFTSCVTFQVMNVSGHSLTTVTHSAEQLFIA